MTLAGDAVHLHTPSSPPPAWMLGLSPGHQIRGHNPATSGRYIATTKGRSQHIYRQNQEMEGLRSVLVDIAQGPEHSYT